MSDRTTTLATVAQLIRAKNAGPFWVTLDVFLSDRSYRPVIDSGLLNPDTVGRLYDIDPADVQIHPISDLHVVKISFPRRHPQASFRDRDVHSGQQHVPLGSLPCPQPEPHQAAPTHADTVSPQLASTTDVPAASPS